MRSGPVATVDRCSGAPCSDVACAARVRGVASAKLVADPTARSARTGPSAVPFDAGVRRRPRAPASTTPPPRRPRSRDHGEAYDDGAPSATTTAATTTARQRPTLAASTSASTLVISGHGWGHGIGHGAVGRGRLRAARLGLPPDPRALLPGHDDRARAGADRARAARRRRTRGHARLRLAAGRSPTRTGRRSTLARRPAAGRRPTSSSRGQTLVSPLTFSPGATPLRVGEHAVPRQAARRLERQDAPGRRTRSRSSRTCSGVVGREMPSDWPAAALEAQAVAARSYALAELENVVTARAYDLYSDTRSQVYGGIDAESAAVDRGGARRRRARSSSTAARSRRRYFSSSSGGRTVSAAEALGEARALPRLGGRPLRHALALPRLGPGALRRAQGRATALEGARRARSTSTSHGRALRARREVTPSAPTATSTLTGVGGPRARSASARRGSRVGWLSLDPAAGSRSPTAGRRTLTGRRPRRRPRSRSRQKAPGGDLADRSRRSRPTRRARSRSRSSRQATTQYRLAAGQCARRSSRCTVAPLVSASLGAGDGAGDASARRSPGAAVQLQRQSGASWTTVATGNDRLAGAFAVAAQLSPGSYRVRCAPGHGLSPGVSQPILQT